MKNVSTKWVVARHRSWSRCCWPASSASTPRADPDGLDQGRRGPGLRRHRDRARRRRRPVRRLRRQGRRQRAAPAASPASSASWSCWPSAAGLVYAVRRRAAPGPSSPDVGAGHGHKLHFHGHSPVHRLPAHLKILALLAFMLVVVATPRDWYAAFACLPRWSLGRRHRRLAGAPDVHPQADGGRGAVRGLRGAAAVRRDRARRSRCSASASASRASRPARAAGQGHARRARQPDAGRHHRAAGPARRPGAAAAARSSWCRSWRSWSATSTWSPARCSG